jgi:hypothetical protein
MGSLRVEWMHVSVTIAKGSAEGWESGVDQILEWERCMGCTEEDVR